MEKLEGLLSPYSKSFYNEENQVFFDPLLYIQRYQVAMACITHKRFNSNKIKKIVEFGCSEMKFFVYLKNGLTDRQTQIHLVDIDENVLISHMRTVQPLICEHIKRREHNLDVHLWKGNVAKPNPNFTDIDCVVALELIEHVYPDVLEEVPYHIFGIIAPKIAIFSTPNCEFNQLFTFREGQVFRHDDHKFEWNREQFRDWCDSICLRFPNYCVQIEGVGTPPREEQLEPIGCCTQLALFIRRDYLESLDQENEKRAEEINETGSSQEYSDFNDASMESCDHYKLLKTVTYPVFVDTRDRLQKIRDEASYHISRFRFMGDDTYYNGEANRTEIPIEDIASACWEICDDKDEILAAIKDQYEIENGLIIFSDNSYDDSECEDNCEGLNV